MQVAVETDIKQKKEVVWGAITNINNWKNVISSILDVEVLNRPDSGIVGLKWKETREMFGKEATETMWITDAQTNQYYAIRAESHGSVYITKLSLSDTDKGCLLTMSFSATPQSFVAKVLSFLMGPFIKKSIGSALAIDLADIKQYVEG